MSLDKEQDLAERIKVRAYHLWEQEGRREGRSDVHWDQASELVAIEDNQRLTTRPIAANSLGPTGEPVENMEVMENLGEFPTLTDQGEEQTFPSRQDPAPPSKSAAKASEPRKKAAAPKGALNGLQGGSKRSKDGGTRTAR